MAANTVMVAVPTASSPHDAVRARLAALLVTPNAGGEASIDSTPAGKRLPTAKELWRHVEGLLAEYGLELDRPPDDAAVDDNQDEDPRLFLWWLLRMAAITYAKQPPPVVDEELLRRFEALVRHRPPRQEEHGQLHIDAESALRRAMTVIATVADHPGPIVAVGDDDAVTLAMALLGQQDLAVLDIDAGLLSFLRETGRELGANIRTFAMDFFDDAVPREIRGQCRAAFTDPIRNFEGAMQFILVGAATLDRSPWCRLSFADHPDWNLDHDAVQAALPSLNHRIIEVHRNLHGYPLNPAVFPLRQRTVEAFNLDAGWLDDLIAASAASSHLYVLGFGGIGETDGVTATGG